MDFLVNGLVSVAQEIEIWQEMDRTVDENIGNWNNLGRSGLFLPFTQLLDGISYFF